MRRAFLPLALLSLLVTPSAANAVKRKFIVHRVKNLSARYTVQGQALPPIAGVPAQPLIAQIRRVTEAFQFLGEPLPPSTLALLDKAYAETDEAKAIVAVQKALERHTLFAVNINPESRVKVAAGPAAPMLVEQGWRQYLVRVHNEAGVTAELKAASPNAEPLWYRDESRPVAKINPRDRWMEIQLFNGQPLNRNLSGLLLEYRIIQIYSREDGQREAKFSFNVGQGTQDLGFRNDVDILFKSLPASEVTLRVKDADGSPSTARFTIRDAAGRVYPSQAKRLAPDFFFHPQIYRRDGEKVRLPKGEYTFTVTRGPEYLVQTSKHTLTGKPATLNFKLARWIDPSTSGYWSGDHHIHAAGCAHYTNPSEGVHAPDMALHCQGEDLKVGCNLTWGPCFDYQKQFFTGHDDKTSSYPYLLRYDVEVSGFGSHQSGHLCLLRLKTQIPPGGNSKDHWPTLGLNTLKWAKAQGALTGPAHSGNGLDVRTTDLPNYIIPPYNGIGANEFVVDVTHEVPGPEGKMVPAVDFTSTVDTNPRSELNMWYHVLNCGFRQRISGETDFPCIFGERVGVGRSYVKMDGKLNYEGWCEGIRRGRNYVSDGMSHLLDFAVNDVEVGTARSEVKLGQPGSVRVTAKVAARLDDEVDENSRRRFPWNLEHARKPGTKEVPLELIVNGYPVASKTILADGKMQDVKFDVKIDRSSWVALRILPSSHTNPVFVLIGDKPIRASKRSAEWCLKGVDQCWAQKQRTYAQAEMQEAISAYEHARKTYQRILGECEVE
jgi:hypothetical protein